MLSRFEARLVLVQQLAAALLAELRALRARAPLPGARPVEHVRDPRLQRAIQYIVTHQAQPLRVRDIAREAGCSPSCLSRLFRASLHTSPHAYLAGTRIQKAALALREGDKVEAVMRSVGYASRRTFVRRFVREFGMTPGDYRGARPGSRRQTM